VVGVLPTAIVTSTGDVNAFGVTGLKSVVAQLRDLFVVDDVFCLHLDDERSQSLSTYEKRSIVRLNEVIENFLETL
jgi:hypothetical protein